MTKKEMRKKMLSLRDSLSEKERMEKSREIAKRLFTLEEFQKAEVVLSYQSFRSEVETTEMNQKIRESGKSLYLPKTYADRKEMAFYRVYSDADLIPGYQGILEPQGQEQPMPDRGTGCWKDCDRGRLGTEDPVRHGAGFCGR